MRHKATGTVATPVQVAETGEVCHRSLHSPQLLWLFNTHTHTHTRTHAHTYLLCLFWSFFLLWFPFRISGLLLVLCVSRCCNASPLGW